MRRGVASSLAAALLLVVVAGCSDDDPPGDADTDTGSAVIVTTTVGAPSTAAPTSPNPTDPTDPTTDPNARATTSDTTPPDSTTSDNTTPDTTPPDTTPPDTTPPDRPVVGDPRVRSEVVARVDSPVGLSVRPGDPAPYVIEQAGRVVRLGDGEPEVVADLTDRIGSGGERGLLGLAFAAGGDLAYVDYTDRRGDTVVSELPVAADGTFDADRERVLLVVEQPYRNHNGGDVAIAPDGTLFVALGDGGSANDPERRASDPTSLLGSLLRIDPTPDGDRPYSIPPDNPFADGDHDGVAGAPEVWAYGLRNPWRFAFDPVSGDLWIADVGQNQLEEVNRVTPVDGELPGRGADFGWSAFEGTERFNSDVADPGDTVPPVLTYRHGPDGCSVSGGVPYRGSAIAELAPAYVYSDYCSGIVWALDLAGERNLRLLDGFENVTAVRTGPDGELYVLEQTGAIHRLLNG